MTHQHAVKTLAAERYLLEEMPELERHAFEDHYFTCAECADDVRLSALMREGVKAGLAGVPADRAIGSTAELARPRLGWQVVLPWAAAASLAVIVGYQSWITLPATRDRFESQALAPISLRPASRGIEPTVELARSPLVTFAIDVNAADQATNLTYDLSLADGTLVVSGRAPAPTAGAPFLLMVPSATLTAGRYVLVIRNADTSATVGEYRFVATR